MCMCVRLTKMPKKKQKNTILFSKKKTLLQVDYYECTLSSFPKTKKAKEKYESDWFC